MKCPTCNKDLVLSERQGVEIDYCPQCRGVWLDRGELDKIIERSERDDDDYRGREYHRSDRDQGWDRERGEYPKRKSFWSELFD